MQLQRKYATLYYYIFNVHTSLLGSNMVYSVYSVIMMVECTLCFMHQDTATETIFQRRRFLNNTAAAKEMKRKIIPTDDL